MPLYNSERTSFSLKYFSYLKRGRKEGRNKDGRDGSEARKD
jgi:hypothetical protein